MLGFKLDSDEAGTPATPTSGLPAAVEQTRAALLAAAESGDYEALAALVPATGFEYTFGGPVEGGPVAYWQELEQTTDERPIEALAAILKMPYVLSRGYYVWPWAYTVGERRRPLGARARAARASGCPERAVPARSRLPRLANRHRARRHLGVLRRGRLTAANGARKRASRPSSSAVAIAGARRTRQGAPLLPRPATPQPARSRSRPRR